MAKRSKLGTGSVRKFGVQDGVQLSRQLDVAARVEFPARRRGAWVLHYGLAVFSYVLVNSGSCPWEQR